jgi:rare lipoprotein A
MTYRILLRLSLLAVLALLPSCKSPRSSSGPVRVQSTEVGVASIYTDRRTASGERYRSTAMAAAHKRWPLGSRVRVTNLYNGRSVIVRINDRGPYIRGRVIDLTPTAASAIGLTRSMGLAKVRIERLL